MTAAPGSFRAVRPTFTLATLEALEDYRHALREREKARQRHASATTREARQGAVQSIDRWGMLAMRAEKRLKEAVMLEVGE